MSTPVKVLVIIACFIVCFAIVGRITGAFRFYSIPSTANEPTLKMGRFFVASNLTSPDLFDFICYKTETKEMGKFVAVSRVCGMEGDVVEIRNGDLFVNNKFVDDRFDLQNEYRLSKNSFEEYYDLFQDKQFFEDLDSVTISMPVSFVKKHKIPCEKWIQPKNFSVPGIKNGWNPDFYGPVRVPKNSYFVLGDNRHGALDSRFIGFISESNRVATVIWK